MRTSRWGIVTVIAVGVAVSGAAQDVADLAARAASNDAAERQTAFEALRALDGAGLEALLDLLKPPEEGGDGEARVALHGLAVRLSVSGAPRAPRAAFARELGEYLQSAAPVACRRFVVIQLRICGAGEGVPGLAAALDDPELTAEALDALAAIPGPRARAALEGAASHDDVNVRVRALELLDRLGDAAARDTLLEGAQAGNGTALAAYVRQADAVRDGGRPDEARAMYVTALGLAPTDELKSLAMYGMAGTPLYDLLRLVEPCLAQNDTREAALRVFVAVALHQAEGGSPWQAEQMLLHALQLGPSRQLAGEIAGSLREMGVNVDPFRPTGFIGQWWLTGPFPGDNIDAEWAPEQGIDLAAPMQAGDREVKWAEHRTPDPSGIVNFAALLQPNTNSTAYMYAEVKVDQAQDVVLKCGSDDGMKLWLNGQLLHRAPQPRGLRVDEDTVEGRLEAGVNKVLVKVVQGGGGWEACIRLTDRTGQALKFSQ
ncbi:MAG: HEAT repeat domain-containing protein [Armatimonadetes bacterium]|nr:HEAT repeat domain-containing protein [Armatimonadota bacterium]